MAVPPTLAAAALHVGTFNSWARIELDAVYVLEENRHAPLPPPADALDKAIEATETAPDDHGDDDTEQKRWRRRAMAR